MTATGSPISMRREASSTRPPAPLHAARPRSLRRWITTVSGCRPEWMRGEALPPQHIRLEHAVALAHAENGPQEAHHIAKLGLGYRRDQPPTPLEASTALSFSTLVLSTVSSI